MVPNFFQFGLMIKPKMLGAVILLVASSLSWSFFILFSYETVFLELVENNFLVYVGQAIFLIFGAISAIFASLVTEKVSRTKFLWFWIFLGTISSISIFAFYDETLIWFSSLLLGISLGLGYPSFTSVLGDCTNIEERARVSGITIFITFITVLSSAMFVFFFDLGLIGIVIVSIFLKILSGVALILESCEKKIKEKITWLQVLNARNFSSYLIPWLMFNIASGLTTFIFLGLPSNYDSAISTGNLMHYLGAALGAIVAGFIADRKGRKRPILFGMVLLAISFASLGLAASPITLFMYLSLSGFAWGFLIVVYLAVPGDVSRSLPKEKFYALGIVLPLLIYAGLGSTSRFITIEFPIASFSSILGIIIALSTIPVFSAKETLPIEKINQRKLKSHLQKIGKLVEESKKEK